MGTGRKFAKTQLTRPTKGGTAKRQRQRQHRERLVALGMPEAEVAKLNPKEARTLLKRPLLVSAKYSS